jgi:hypothetical protein
VRGFRPPPPNAHPTCPHPGYDHIVPVSGYTGTAELYYNDLWRTRSSRILRLPTDIQSRAQCVMRSPRQPYAYCLPTFRDYGLAVTGVVDPLGELLPISLSVGRCVSEGGGGGKAMWPRWRLGCAAGPCVLESGRVWVRVRRRRHCGLASKKHGRAQSFCPEVHAVWCGVCRGFFFYFHGLLCMGGLADGCAARRSDSEPDWGAEDNLDQAPVTLTPVVTATGLTVGTEYALLRFDSPGALPSAGGFLASLLWSEKVLFVAATPVMQLSTPHGLGTISSDGTYFYRCVLSGRSQ